MGSGYFVWAGLELLGSSDPPAATSSIAGTTGMRCHACLKNYFSLFPSLDLKIDEKYTWEIFHSVSRYSPQNIHALFLLPLSSCIYPNISLLFRLL
jgi:hypothetical protein